MLLFTPQIGGGLKFARRWKGTETTHGRPSIGAQSGPTSENRPFHVIGVGQAGKICFRWCSAFPKAVWGGLSVMTSKTRFLVSKRTLRAMKHDGFKLLD